MKLSRPLIVCLLFGLALGLQVSSACASGPSIVSNTSSGIDFRKFRTFDFHEPLGTDRARGVRTPLSTHLMSSMERELSSRGLTRSDSPDLLVDFSTWIADRVDVRTSPSHSVRRSGWHRSLSTWPTYHTTVRQYTEGSLIIDLIDPNSNQLVAEGNATSRISNNDFTGQQVDDVVAQIMDSIWAN